jgi:hypothetical protein
MAISASAPASTSDVNIRSLSVVMMAI